MLKQATCLLIFTPLIVLCAVINAKSATELNDDIIKNSQYPLENSTGTMKMVNGQWKDLPEDLKNLEVMGYNYEISGIIYDNNEKNKQTAAVITIEHTGGTGILFHLYIVKVINNNISIIGPAYLGDRTTITSHKFNKDSIDLQLRLADHQGGGKYKFSNENVTYKFDFTNKKLVKAKVKTGKDDAKTTNDVSNKSPEANRASNENPKYISIKAGMKRIRLFESSSQPTPYNERTYQIRFNRKETRYIAYELTLDHRPFGRKVDFEIMAIWYGPDDKVAHKSVEKFTIGPEFSDSVCAAGWRFNGGAWTPGIYKVDLMINGNKAAWIAYEIY